MAQEIEIIVKRYPMGMLRSKVTQVAPSQTYGIITGDKQAEEIARFGGSFAVDANVATLVAAIDSAYATGGVVFRS